MVIRITDISFDRSIIENDGSLTSQSRTFFRTLTNQALIIGSGSPEGVVIAEIGASYMDDTGITGAISYIKRDADDAVPPTPDKSKGWVLV